MGPRCNNHLIEFTIYGFTIYDLSANVWVLTIFTQDMKLDSVFTDFITSDNIRISAKEFGQLVVLGFDVTVFTPAPYQRHRL